VIPNPDGTVTGTCAYELSSDLDNYETHAADLNAEVDAENTGNVGIVLTVTVTYPQLAHPSIVMTKKVNVPYGQTVTVPFTADHAVAGVASAGLAVRPRLRRRLQVQGDDRRHLRPGH